jgi:hypothetical protein
MNNSLGLSSVRMTRTTRSVKERRKWTTNKEISLNNPQRGEEQGTAGHTPPAGTTSQKGGGD